MLTFKIEQNEYSAPFPDIGVLVKSRDILVISGYFWLFSGYPLETRNIQGYGLIEGSTGRRNGG